MDLAATARFVVFLTALLLLAWAERCQPAWPQPLDRQRVRIINLGLGVAGVLCTRILVALAGADWLGLWQAQHPGLLGMLRPALGTSANLAGWVVGLLALDAALYLQHRIFHAIPWLWRWHGVHHSDAHLDVTSALRFHPLELALSWLWKLLIAAVLGLSPLCLLVFEAALSTLALFNHANLRLGERWERWLAPWLITPAAHRRHHRDDAVADAPNFGFSVPWWDQLAGTWAAALPERTLPVRVGVRDWVAGATASFWQLVRGKSL